MLSLLEIKKQYSQSEQPFGRNMLREYLQFKILQIIFNSKYSRKLSFFGGTALRIVHQSNRFSEDLDFDNFSLKEKEFDEISQLVKRELELEGYEIEIRNVFKGAFHCYLRIPRLLFDSGLSGYENEKILIQLDSASHDFHYTPEKPILNKFDVFVKIYSTPLDIVLSQKMFAVFNRKSKKGRDFYDIVFILSKTKPSYEYLKLKLGISDANQLRKEMKTICEGLNFEELARDVEPFLINPKESQRIALFEEFFANVDL